LAMLKFALIVVVPVTTTLETTIPEPLTLTVALAGNPVPDRVTGTMAPCNPLAGATLVRVIAGAGVPYDSPQKPPVSLTQISCSR
jgi:hypothetical protein